MSEDEKFNVCSICLLEMYGLCRESFLLLGAFSALGSFMYMLDMDSIWKKKNNKAKLNMIGCQRCLIWNVGNWLLLMNEWNRLWM